jgi:hypothetical protein
MSYNQKRKGLSRWKRKPGWITYHQLGSEFAAQLPVHSSWEAIGKKFRISRQNAFHEGVVALGKLCYRLRELRSSDNL